ncbi:MAG: M20/M25/M40 family metallo-hydrolase [Acidobacteria bacterium]|nr:M20/M25/M40 family metallo-hydrolase [Acidobacteriota bacterium]
MFRSAVAAVALSAVILTPGGVSTSAQSSAARVDAVLRSPAVQRAFHVLDRDHDRLIADIVALTQITAPPFKEDARATAYLERLRAAGLADVERDAEGNVMGLYRGDGTGPLIVVASHLDTVFPEGTDVRVRRDGTRLFAPGIGDNSRSLAVLLAIVRAMLEANVQTAGDILFVGNVGEEGPGDLRGVKYLFTQGRYKGRISRFVSIDGAGSGSHITTGGVGSRRYRVRFAGPGGHSYGAFGLVSPAFALGKAMDKLSRISVPVQPRTTFNVGVIGGGTSVNSIPSDVWADVDLRSEDAGELNRLETQFRTLMAEAAAEENNARSTRQGPVTVELTLIGDRPSGSTPRGSDIVDVATAVVRSAGMFPSYGTSSTDSNIPMSLGVPAITIDSGGEGGRAHAPDEWIDVAKSTSLPGVRNAMLLLLALAGLR